MSNDTTSLESDLLKLRAASPNEALLARLEACAAGTWTELTPEESALELNLRSLRPAPLSSDLQASLESLFADVEFPSEIQIIPFPATTKPTAHANRRWWAAAAAVALVGGLTALMIPGGRNLNGPPVAGGPTSPVGGTATHASVDSSQFIPAGFNRDFREAKDEGVVWQSGHKAHRVLRVVYMDRVTLKSPDGKSCVVEQPRVEYILTPEEAD